MPSMKTIYKWLNNVQQASRNVEMKTTDSVYDNLQHEKDSVTDSTKQISLFDGLHNRVFVLPHHPIEQLALMTPLLFLLATNVSVVRLYHLFLWLGFSMHDISSRFIKLAIWL